MKNRLSSFFISEIFCLLGFTLVFFLSACDLPSPGGMNLGRKPGKIQDAPEGCVVNIGMGALLYPEPDPFSVHFAVLEGGKSYEPIELSRYNHGGLTTINMFKIHDEETGLTGWVSQMHLAYTDPKCL